MSPGACGEAFGGGKRGDGVDVDGWRDVEDALDRVWGERLAGGRVDDGRHCRETNCLVGSMDMRFEKMVECLEAR